MAQFLLTAMPFTGHVRPIAAVAAALVGRGHDVRIYTGSRFRRDVEAAGATFVRWERAPDFDENDLAATFPRLLGKPGISQLFTNLIDCFIRTAPAQVDDLAAEWERKPWDAQAGEDTSVGGALFAERAGVAWATISIVPLSLDAATGPPSGLGLTPGIHPVTRARDAVLRRLVPAFSQPISAALRAASGEVGLGEAKRSMGDAVFSRRLIVASGCARLDFDRRDRPASVEFVGELRTQPASVAPPEPMPAWWGDLAGRDVVLVTQGTHNTDPTALIQPTVAALAERNVLVVATTGVPGVRTVPFAVPANARIADLVPFAALLPHVSAVVTNGGWGGTLTALAHGVPLVIAGGDLDKPETAARVAWTGAGISLRSGRPATAAVGAAVERVLYTPSYRDAAVRLGAELRSLGGASRAAQLLETLLA